MKLAITGCNGFIGSHLVKRLLKDGHDLIKIDFNYGYDLTDWSSLQSLEKFDVLFHLAAKSYVPESYDNPQPFYYTNIVGTLNALELCRLHNAKMIYTSSYVYGQPKYLPIDEEHLVIPFNPYAQSKIIGEDLCKAYHRDFGLNVLTIRPFNIYGTGQSGRLYYPNYPRTGKIRNNKLEGSGS